MYDPLYTRGIIFIFCKRLFKEGFLQDFLYNDGYCNMKYLETLMKSRKILIKLCVFILKF